MTSCRPKTFHIVLAIVTTLCVLAMLRGNTNDGNREPNMVTNFYRYLRTFRRSDFVEFVAEHDRMFENAKKTGDHSEVTYHYYDMMAPIIEGYYGPNWHFCAPETPDQSQEDATINFHKHLADLMHMGPGMTCLDIGSGVGGLTRDMALYTGARVTGITIGKSETARAQELHESMGVGNLCQAIEGNAEKMPFPDKSFDRAYIVYALKYFCDISIVLKEAARVLKPGGLLMAYCILKTPKYDDSNAEHRDTVAAFELACCMPSFHTTQQVMDTANAVGFDCLTNMDIGQGRAPWYHFFVKNKMFMKMLNSNLTHRAVRVAESIGAVPKGFTAFNKRFLSGNVTALVRAGQLGILTGSQLFVFRKREVDDGEDSSDKKGVESPTSPGAVPGESVDTVV